MSHKNIYILCLNNLIIFKTFLKHCSLTFYSPPHQYLLNDKISYPEDTFMDWEFKISVMYDIAKVSLHQFLFLHVL